MTESQEKIVWKGLETGVRLATQAIEEERKKNYEKALILYEESEGYYIHSLKHEVTDVDAKNALKNHFKNVLSRAEQVRSYLERKR